MSFNGACANATVELNTMNTHRVGLGLYFSGNIGQQYNNTNLPYYNYGNIWQGTYSNYGAYLGNPTFLRRNQNAFKFDGAGISNFPPTSNTPSNTWFIADSDPDLQLSRYACTPKPLAPITPEDYNIANGLLDPSTPYQEQNYESNRYLFEKIKNDPSLIQFDPILSAYYNQNFNTNIGRFGKISLDIDNATRWQVVYSNVYDFNLELISQKNDSIVVIKDSLSLTPENQTLLSLLSNLSNEVGDLNISNENIKSVCDQVREAQVNGLINENENLIDEELYESNEMAVNDIYLNTVGRENYFLTLEQILTLQGIIFQCPFSGGASVYKARTLYSMVNDSIDYDDYDLCVFQGVAPRQSKDQSSVSALLFPNPTSNFVTLNYQLHDHVNSIFRIIDQLGRVVLKQKLTSEVNQIQLDCSFIKAGIYTYQIVVDDVIQNSNLLSIVK